MKTAGEPHPGSMSFQGDVRGIGLAELLQGLARGRKQGVVTLSSRGNPRVLVGLSDGKAYLLPTDEEPTDFWQELVKDAWLDAPGTRIEHLHIAEVARANRLEQLYCLLDGDGAHFRFEPRDLAFDAEGRVIAGSNQPPVSPLAIEGMLLEYARIADERQGVSPNYQLSADAIAAIYDPAKCESLPQVLFNEVDGRSTVAEIANRLGWTLRQASLSLEAGLENGGLYTLTGDQILVLAMEELRRKAWRRAAVRLTAWTQRGTPGALDTDAVEVLVSEWGSGRLVAAVRMMEAHAVWTLLRRLDHGLGQTNQAVLHWIEAARTFPDNLLIQLHRLAQEAADGSNPERPPIQELLKLARTQIEKGFLLRAQPALRLAQDRAPETAAERLELGQLLLESGLAHESAPWLIAACEDFIMRGLSDRAVLVLRELTAALPGEREARLLLSRARRSTNSARRLRRRLLFTLAGVAGLAGVALVQVNTQRQRSGQLAEVRALLADPDRAIWALQQKFPGDTKDDVQALKRAIEEKQRAAELELRDSWLDQYEAVGHEARRGDSLRALDLARSLSNPPTLRLVQGIWPLKSDLLASIPEALGDQATGLGAPRLDDPDQVKSEDSLSSLARALRAALNNPPDHAEESLSRGLDALDAQLLERKILRADLASARTQKHLRSDQNQLLKEARSRDESGELESALSLYAELFQLDAEGDVRAALAEEHQDLVRRANALERARAEARAGRHHEAWELLGEHMQDPEAWYLPAQITSAPSGATIRMPSGAVATTPLVHEMRRTDVFAGRLQLDGYLDEPFELRGPSNLHAVFSRIPVRSWRSSGRVDAVPVPVDSDHIMVDRNGNLARVGHGGKIVWSQKVATLSGISRAPVFLPQLENRMLLVTEEGQAFLLAADTGKLTGPWDLKSPPSMGPTQGTDFVQLRLANGSVAIWTNSLRPEILPAGSRSRPLAKDDQHLHGSDCGLQVWRRGDGPLKSMTSRFGGWVLTRTAGIYLVAPADDPQAGLSAASEGPWYWVAFESRAAGELLWVSDEAGLRAFDLIRKP